MKPAPFKYYAPHTLQEALVLLSEHGYDAKVLAGGQSLIPTLNFRMAQPQVIIDINRLSDLSFIEPHQSGGLQIGAMTRQSQIEKSSLVQERQNLIFEAMPYIAHPQIRNRGTIGGSIAHADPAAELPAIMIALKASFHLQNQDDDRWVSADEFFTGMFATVLEPSEILTEIEIAAPPANSGYAFYEVARRHGDFALVGVAAVVSIDQKHQCVDTSIAFLSVGDGPVQARQAVQILLGNTFSEELVNEAAEVAASQDIDPPSDIHASAKYRRHLAKVLTKKALITAFERTENK